MELHTMFLVLVAIAAFLVFPLYAGIQAYRKGAKTAAVLTYVSIFALLGFPVALIVFFACKLWQPNLDASPHLISFSGCGPGFCGATARADDGTFLSTEWFRLFGVPIVPIQSYRISYGGGSTKFSGVVISESKQYYIYSKEKLNLIHVVRTYAILTVFLLALPTLIDQFNDGLRVVAVLVALVFVALAIVFWRAK